MEADIQKDKSMNKVKNYKESIEYTVALLKIKIKLHYMKANMWII